MPSRSTRLLVAGGVVVLAAWALAAVRPHAGWAPLLDSFHWTCAFCVAAWIAWRAARSAPAELRLVRGRFAAGLCMLAAGQLAWDALSWIGWNPFPGLPNLLYLMLSPLFGYGFAGMVGDQLPRAQWRSVVLDVGGFGLAVLAFTLALYLPHSARCTVLEFLVLIA